MIESVFKMTMRLLTFYLLFLSYCSSGQHTLNGVVVDEDSATLTGATIVLLNPQDSSMISFGISDNNGKYLLENLEMGQYILQVTFVSFNTTFRNIDIDGTSKNVDLGTIWLEASSEVLQEVMVTAEHIPMGISGDTISYNASAFKTQPGATVEDLLKKLPGIDVQRDGSIKAMGEDVNNVLVDGKEFFGNDPKIATQNLQAEAVDKVELYDKKSEMTEFTGIDDGAEEKTINLKLKEEYKDGGFGNVEIAGGTDSKYDSKLNYNRFSPKMQAAAIISANNINKQAFSFNEFIQFMGGIGNAISANNGVFNFGEFSQPQAPRGLSDNISGGLNLNYDFSPDFKLTSHYFYLSTDQILNSQTLTNEFSDSERFQTINDSKSKRKNQNHRLTAKLDYKPNPFLQIVWKNNFYGILRDLDSESSTQFFNEELQEALTSTNYINANDQFGYEGSLQLRGKFKKKGRNWINTLNYQTGNYEDQNELLADYDYANNLGFSINQFQTYSYNKENGSYQSAYTEPLGAKFYLGLDYEFTLDQESPDKKFYDKTGNTQVFNEELSAQYTKTNTLHRGELSIRKNAKKVKLNAALGVQYSNIESILEDENLVLDNRYRHILSSGSVEWEMSKEKNFDFSYRSSLSLPTLNQLAPLPDNSNSNILILGNPDLNPEKIHRFGIGYSSFDHFYYKNFYVRANIDFIENRIINALDIDENFLKTYRPINSDQYVRTSGHASYSAPFKPLALKYHIDSRYSYARYHGSLNEKQSKVNESNINVELLLENRNKDHIDVATGIRMDYNIRKYEINEDFNQTFFNYSLFVDGIFYLGKNWTLNSSLDYIAFSDEFFAERQTFNLWNASIRKSFSEDRFSIYIRAYDILKQNIGVNRSGNLNSLTEERFNTLNQYFLMGLKYKIGNNKRKDAIEF